MGKKRIVKPEKDKTARKIVKTGKQQGRLSDMGEAALIEAEKIKAKEKEIASKTSQKQTKTKKPARPQRRRGKRYLQVKTKIKANQLYPLSRAIKLLKTVSISRFNGSVETHLVVRQPGLKGEISFPYATGKTTKIAIANDQVLKQIEKGKIDFNVLLAEPAMMPKLAKYARVLGPKGLMPNPKNGTITDKPKETAKKLSGQVQFKTEAKMPLIHLVIAKINQPDAEIEANFKALVEAIGPNNLLKAVLSPTMGPAIKVDLEKLS